MDIDNRNIRATAASRASLLRLSVLSLIVGGMIGVVCASFRLALVEADQLRGQLIVWAQGIGTIGALVAIAVCSAAAAVAAWMVRRLSPHASGSGIPHVEAVLRRELPQAPFLLVPVKFVGGLLAIGAGLALGREGPSVQIGAGIAHLFGRLFRCDVADCLVLLAGGAGAGLATAFNAPIAGAVFVLEELVRRFDTRITIATFGTSAGAIAVSRLFLGDSPDFQVAAMPYADARALPLYLILGVFAGVLGIAYNRAILGALTATSRLQRWPVELRAAAIGLLVGLLAYSHPDLVGGGDPLTQATLAGNIATTGLLLALLCRFALGPISYAARTPGGLFAPMLVLGSQAGTLFGIACNHLSAEVTTNSTAFAVVGMAAFFTAVVRSPVTGIVLVIELTGNSTLLLPMLCACFTAMLIPTLLRDPPIYEALREDSPSPS